MSSEDSMGGQETADYLGVSYARLYTLMREGKLTRLDEPDALHRKAPLRFQRSEVEKLKRNAGKKSPDAA